MNEGTGKVIESEELDQAEELEEDLEIETADETESAGDDDFDDIDEEEAAEESDAAEDDADDDESAESEESDNEEKALQKEDAGKPADKASTKTEETASDDEILKQFEPHQIPGTDAYTDALIAHAQQVVKSRTGEEYDPFDAKHQALFTQACNKLDRIATEKFNESYGAVKSQVSYQQAFKKASVEIDSILATPELAEKFEAAIGELKQKEFLAIQKKAQETGDFSGFIEIAKRVKGVKSKVDQINGKAAGTITRQAPETTERNKPEKLANGVEFGGVADFLGL